MRYHTGSHNPLSSLSLVFLTVLTVSTLHLYFYLFVIVQNNITPAEISQWTNHRVMEWLRSVDLAEYAPNLRGSGVHGGLMVRGAGAESI